MITDISEWMRHYSRAHALGEEDYSVKLERVVLDNKGGGVSKLLAWALWPLFYKPEKQTKQEKR